MSILKNITDANREKNKKINGYEFDWNENHTYNGTHDIGVIAQEIEEILPEIKLLQEKWL